MPVRSGNNQTHFRPMKCRTNYCRNPAESESVAWCTDCIIDGKAGDIPKPPKPTKEEVHAAYDISCMACGRSYWRKLTPDQFKKYGLWLGMGMEKCESCKGRLMIERSDYGSMGTSNPGKRLAPLGRR